jgi:hypothetical protein
MSQNATFTEALHGLDFTRINPHHGGELPDWMQAYKTKAGKIQIRPDLATLEELDGEELGFCLNCGAHEQFAEPDMVRGTCEECGEEKVYGAAELVIRGLYF